MARRTSTSPTELKPQAVRCCSLRRTVAPRAERRRRRTAKSALRLPSRVADETRQAVNRGLKKSQFSAD